MKLRKRSQTSVREWLVILKFGNGCDDISMLVLSLNHGSEMGPCIETPHDDVIKWKHFPRYWPFVLGIHRSPVNSPHKGQWRGALMFSLICARINRWVYNGEAGDWRRHLAHYDVTIMIWYQSSYSTSTQVFGYRFISIGPSVTKFCEIWMKFSIHKYSWKCRMKKGHCFFSHQRSNAVSQWTLAKS